MVESRQQISEQQDANECFLEFIRLLQQIKSDATVFKAHPIVISSVVEIVGLA